MSARAYIGTSGYNYRHWWEGVFYPREVPQREWLEYYARSFDSVELNVTFYRLPPRSVFEGWKRRTPAGFAFAIKGSRYITHTKRLKDCRDPLNLFFEHAAGLGRKLRVVLWQLHPMMKADSGRLEDFCELLKQTRATRRARHAFEFRHESWFSEEIYDILRERNHALCIAHSPGWPCREVVTAGFVYFRFHGGERLYGSEYSEEELAEWSTKACLYFREGRDVYGYFNNDAHGFAVRNALRLKELTSTRAG